MPEITYSAPPTLAAFMQSEAFVRIAMGPVGSGKTTACIFEMLRRSIEQRPAPDGKRYTRWAILRQTLKQLEDTVLKDIMQWVGPIATYKVQGKTVIIEFGDVYSEWLLLPMEDMQDQRRLLSSQLTGAWFSEAIEVDPNLVSAVSGRCGRYPGANLGGASWFGIIADTNFPTMGSEWHKLTDLDVPAEWQVFKQPGGLEPDAENLEWLTQTPETLLLPVDDPVRKAQGRKYYERLASSNSPDWINRYVHAQYGADPSGLAVFSTTFKRSFHVAETVEPVYGHPIIVAQDFGRNPCALIGQIDHHGRLLVLHEIASEDIGLELHTQRFLKPLLSTHKRYFGKQIFVVGDPAGMQRSTSYEETSFDVLKRNGLSAFPAPTNDIDKRIRAVDAYLMAQRDGGPAILIDEENCPKLVLALSGQYKYARMRNGQLKPLPDKTHPWSDLADALQYLCLVAHGGYAQYVSNRLNRPARSAGVTVSSRAWT